VFGTIDGVVTEDLETIRGLLVARIGRGGKVPVAVPIQLLDEWWIKNVAVSSRELDAFE
jgi:hypothetical protein